LRGWLESHFYAAGCFIILAGCLVLCLLLALDFLLVPLLPRLWRVPRGAIRVLRGSAWGFAPDARAPRRRETAWPGPQSGPRAPAEKGNGSAETVIPIRHPAPALASVGGAPNTSAEPAHADRLVPIVRPGPDTDDVRFADYELPPVALLE